MSGGSRPVDSPQTLPHPRLAEIVRRHLETPSRAPIPAHSRAAFEVVATRLAADPERPVDLDSGCGTGMSTLTLAEAAPEAWVIGIDRSEARLRRGPAASQRSLPPNLLLLRSEVAAFWRMARGAGLRLRRHWLLYPNPSPKPEHLMRRWHGHPAFADLLALGGNVCLRSNWSVYVEEFALALGVAGIDSQVQTVAAAAAPISPFEAKYAASGHALFEVRAGLASADRSPL